MNADWNVMIWALIPIIAILGIVASAILTVHSRARIRELEIRERIAMIERGLVPPPEVDPHGFDRAMDRLERAQVGGLVFAPRAARHRRSGVILMGVGLGLMVLIGLSEEAGDLRHAVGVGGFLVIVGLAFFLSSFFEVRSDPSFPAPPAPPPSRQAPPSAPPPQRPS
jgi:hypothetical protein